MPTRAWAAAEEEWQFGVSAGGARVAADGASPLGAIVGVDAQYGFNDAWAARAAVEAAWLERVNQDAVVRVGHAALGITYSLDVLRLLPFVEGSVCVLGVGGGVADKRSDVGLQVGLGADYLLNPRYSVGLIGRYTYLPVQLTGSDTFGETPQLATVSLRVSYRVF
ncbi:MAG: hypothetical protein SF187_16030 [Deltaproteobacteria bacterium]|nr:hypothetical protein [Deltaproteobacteria bacterium]